MARAELALKNDRHEVDRAESNEVKGQDPRQPVDEGERPGARFTQMSIAAENHEFERMRQLRNRDHDRPYRHMKAEYRGSDVLVASARVNIEQCPPGRNDQQEDRKKHADADVLISWRRAANSKVQSEFPMTYRSELMLLR